MRSPTVTVSTSFDVYSIADKPSVYNIFNSIIKNNLTGYKYDAIILVTSQVTQGSFGGEKCGKRQFAQVVHGQSRLHSKNVGSGTWNFGADLNTQAQETCFWYR
nr:MAG TPA: hypothetical protein [Caudoviricetes sp.]